VEFSLPHKHAVAASPAAVPTEEVLISSLIEDRRFQARSGLHQPHVSRLKQAYVAHSQLPPIRVAVVGGRPFLVDGWHRVAALRALGRAEVTAFVSEETVEGALGLAAKANLAHGLPLKPKEAKAAYRQYIKAKLNLDAKGHRKSYREMAAELGKPHTTIRNWTKEMFPKLYRLMGAHQDVPWERDDLASGSFSEGRAIAEVHYHLEQALAHSLGVRDPVARWSIVERAGTLLSKIKADAPFNAPDF
jgi:hypothetical protein